MTEAKSAYPVPVDELVPQARALAGRLGAVPSRNRLMREFRIGPRKANTLLTRLAAEPGEWREQSENAGLHLVREAEADPPRPDRAPSGEVPTGPIPVVSDPGPEPPGNVAGPGEATEADAVAAGAVPGQATGGACPETSGGAVSGRRVSPWPLYLLALPAFVAIWSGWVGLGAKTGFGLVYPLPGIADGFAVNTAITLPIGVEAYAAYALRVWLSGRVPARARRFAMVSALGSLALGALGQIAFHLMDAAAIHTAPWPITTLVSCLPVAVLGMGAALTHLLHDTHHTPEVAR